MNMLEKYRKDNDLMTFKAVVNHMSKTYGVSVNHVIMVLGQGTVESGEFTACRENMSYRIERLVELWDKGLWRKYLSRDGLAKFARNARALANRVYANRMGNGDEASGDGYRNRGAGMMQLTGDDNLDEFFESLGLPPDTDRNQICDNSHLYFYTGFHFVKNAGLRHLCEVVSRDNITKLSRGVNRGNPLSSKPALDEELRITNTLNLYRAYHG